MSGSRKFLSPDEAMAGGGAVAQSGDFPENIRPWPYSMSDYLQSHVGRAVRVKFDLGGGVCEKRGILAAAGMNFIGLQPCMTRDLFIVELSAVKCVEVLDYKGPGRGR
ncbi:MAG: hypothetical protein GXX89_04570 [Clostridiales bacterium]|jgi:hypothetical protein|nr:hypothetical protein [Clostridiales bacterium]